MAAPPVSTSWPRAHAEAAPEQRSATLGALVLAAAVPLVFLHVRYQPDLGFGVGGTHVDVWLSDLAVLAVALAALADARARGIEPLRRGTPVWLAGAALLAIVLVSLSYPLLRGDGPYDWHARLVSALKFCEYAVLAPAAVLLLRRPADARLPLRALVAWSVAATTWGVLQFTGTVNEFAGKRPAQREPSFLGIHDFAALSGGALALGLVAVALRQREAVGRLWAWLGIVAGGLGIAISGAMTAVIGMWLAVLVLGVLAYRRWLLTRRSASALAIVAVLVTLGTAGMRGTALRDFASFLGLQRNETPGAVESYAQRTVLGYIGLRIWRQEPVTGVGYQGSSDPWAFEPELAAAHRRFPGQPADAFPSRSHPWGVQNLYVEMLADLGLVGAAALCALFAAALVLGVRGSTESPLATVGLAWLLVATGVWLGLGIVPGIPLAALTWLALGLVTLRG